VFRFTPAKGLFRDLSAWQTHWALCPKLPSSLPSRKVSEESLGQDEIKELHKTSHKKCSITSNCPLYCQYFNSIKKKIISLASPPPPGFMHLPSTPTPPPFSCCPQQWLLWGKIETLFFIFYNISILQFKLIIMIVWKTHCLSWSALYTVPHKLYRSCTLIQHLLQHQQWTVKKMQIVSN